LSNHFSSFSDVYSSSLVAQKKFISMLAFFVTIKMDSGSSSRDSER
jgi:hypothetical protein